MGFFYSASKNYRLLLSGTVADRRQCGQELRFGTFFFIQLRLSRFLQKIILTVFPSGPLTNAFRYGIILNVKSIDAAKSQDPE